MQTVFKIFLRFIKRDNHLNVCSEMDSPFSIFVYILVFILLNLWSYILRMW